MVPTLTLAICISKTKRGFHLDDLELLITLDFSHITPACISHDLVYFLCGTDFGKLRTF